jgi:hypothetical protein
MDWAPYWCAARTEPRREAAAAHFLGLAGYTTYLPRLRERRSHGGRRIIATPPLFPSYILPRMAGGYMIRANRRRVGKILSRQGCLDDRYGKILAVVTVPKDDAKMEKRLRNGVVSPDKAYRAISRTNGERTKLRLEDIRRSRMSSTTPSTSRQAGKSSLDDAVMGLKLASLF